jgi:hypothetical protein
MLFGANLGIALGVVWRLLGLGHALILFIGGRQAPLAKV